MKHPCHLRVSKTWVLHLQQRIASSWGGERESFFALQEAQNECGCEHGRWRKISAAVNWDLGLACGRRSMSSMRRANFGCSNSQEEFQSVRAAWGLTWSMEFFMRPPIIPFKLAALMEQTLHHMTMECIELFWHRPLASVCSLSLSLLCPTFRISCEDRLSMDLVLSRFSHNWQRYAFTWFVLIWPREFGT